VRQVSVNYNQPTINNRLTQVVNAIDGGGANAVMRLLTASNIILSSLPLARPCGTVLNGVITFAGMSLIDPSAAATGTANFARIEDSTGTVVISGLTVGQSSNYDIVFGPTNNVVAGQTVAITQASITGN
jgi:hypothetical protein